LGYASAGVSISAERADLESVGQAVKLFRLAIRKGIQNF
jgi:hypothetical protein